MRVFFAASTSELDKSYDLYKIICNEIVKNGHELTRDWLDEGLENYTQKLSVDYDEMYDDIMASILYADIGVVEGTLRGLSTGHQITIALQRGKPILFLRKKGHESEQLLMLRGAHSDLIHELEYQDEKEIPKIIKSFFNSQKKGKKVRFNLVLSQKEHQYIDWASYMYDKSKTDVIRELIKSRMESDLNYSRKVPPNKHL